MCLSFLYVAFTNTNIVFIYTCRFLILSAGITLDKAGYPELEGAIKHQVDEAKLVNHPSWTLKLIQVSNATCSKFQSERCYELVLA